MIIHTRTHAHELHPCNTHTNTCTHAHTLAMFNEIFFPKFAMQHTYFQHFAMTNRANFGKFVVSFLYYVFHIFANPKLDMLYNMF